MKLEIEITNELFAKEVIFHVNLYRNGEISYEDLKNAIHEVANVYIK